MERTHLKGASVDAINVSRGGQQYLPNGTDLTTIDNQRDPGRIAYSLDTRPRAVLGF
jgi:IS30 family transposase